MQFKGKGKDYYKIQRRFIFFWLDVLDSDGNVRIFKNMGEVMQYIMDKRKKKVNKDL